MRTPKNSIVGKAQRNVQILLGYTCLLIGTIFLFNVMSNMHSRTFIARIGESAKSKTLVSEVIPDTLYQMVIGREKIDEEKRQAQRSLLLAQMESLHKNNDAGNVEYAVLGRMLETYIAYIQEMIDNIRNDGSVDESIRLLGNVRSMGSLMAKKVEDYIQVTVNYEVKYSAVFQIVYDIFVVLEVIALISLGFYMVHSRRKLMNYIQGGIQNL